MKHKVCIIIGTRPEAIKLAPIVREFERRAGAVDPLVITTAQHREMTDEVLRLFRIRPRYDLDIMRPGQGLFEVTARALAGLRPVLAKEKPDMVMIQGDTTTVLIGALAAFYFKIPVAHVEAGLRTRDRYQPFPEEVNRRLTSVLADLHFAPTAMARDNLLREGIPADRIRVTGNTVTDALVSVLDKKFDLAGAVKSLRNVDLRRRKIIVITAHRRENFGKPLAGICDAIQKITAGYPDTEIVFSVHPNPAVQRTVHDKLARRDRVHLLRPLRYDIFINLMARAYLILTDSGGIQEEAPFMGKPVLVLRNLTERQEAVRAGSSKLVGTDSANIVRNVKALLTQPSRYRAMTAHNPYGEAGASRRIVTAVLSYLNVHR